MPIYLYRCDNCSETHESLQKISDPLLKTCPHCGQDKLRKIIAPVGVIFKGAGFHKNDYTGGGKKTSSSSTADGGGDKKTEGGDKKSEGGGTTDSKPAESSPSTSSDSGGSGDSSQSKSDKVA